MILRAALSLAVCLSAPLAANDRAPSLVLIVADDLGYGDLGCYGQQVIQTPHIDQLAAEGLRLTHFYAGSTVCAPSRCVLMTGLDTGKCLIRGNGKTNLRPEDATMAKVLQGAGYQTGCFGKWGLGHEGSTGLPTRQGFDAFFGYLDQHHAHNYYPTFLIDGEERHALPNVVPTEGQYGQGKASEKIEYAADTIHDRALTWMRGLDPGRPFFLFYPSTLPHANNEAGREGMEVPSYGPYVDEDWPEPQKGHAAMISHLDRQVGELVALLEELDRARDTLVIFTSDNGPHREGGNDPDFHDSNGPLRGIKRALTDGGIRVPTVVRWPGVTRRGSSCDHALGFVDLLATAADLCAASAAAPTDGVSLLPSLRGGAAPQRDALYWEFYEGDSAQAVRFGAYKAIRAPLFHGPIELYDVVADPGEETNLAQRRPDLVRRAEGLLAAGHTPSELWKRRR
ncbi:MAG: arylsulfatase [Planctomycetota bacterium]|nr:arylsulfatase [Planctomycetota bacterium]